MSLAAGILLGILIGWLIEWAIDWFYMRPRWTESARLEAQTEARSRAASLAHAESVKQTAAQAVQAVPLTGFAPAAPDRTAEIETLKTENASLREQIERLTHRPDDLQLIRGIGPEIEHRLNQAGITTFAQLAQLTPADLENILGVAIKRLANEQDLIDQARQYASQKQ
jgi:predicted flap endonuclease-1-like 5' DNA nuclease